jgi:hypothetical protein
MRWRLLGFSADGGPTNGDYYATSLRALADVPVCAGWESGIGGELAAGADGGVGELCVAAGVWDDNFYQEQ